MKLMSLPNTAGELPTAIKIFQNEGRTYVCNRTHTHTYIDALVCTPQCAHAHTEIGVHNFPHDEWEALFETDRRIMFTREITLDFE